jgi:hypothetical protein
MHCSGLLTSLAIVAVAIGSALAREPLFGPRPPRPQAPVAAQAPSAQGPAVVTSNSIDSSPVVSSKPAPSSAIFTSSSSSVSSGPICGGTLQTFKVGQKCNPKECRVSCQNHGCADGTCYWEQYLVDDHCDCSSGPFTGSSQPAPVQSAPVGRLPVVVSNQVVSSVPSAPVDSRSLPSVDQPKVVVDSAPSRPVETPSIPVSGGGGCGQTLQTFKEGQRCNPKECRLACQAKGCSDGTCYWERWIKDDHCDCS